MADLHKCQGCSRLTTALYCCEPCSRAHGKWDIEGEHSEGCNQRHAQREKK